MTQNDEKNQHQQPQLCPKCKKMYGHVDFEYMCSTCYKKEKNIGPLLAKVTTSPRRCAADDRQSPNAEVQPPSLKRQLPKEEEKSQISTGRCVKCNKKTGMLGYACKHCSHQFCKFHRLPEDHSCEVDFVTLGRKKIKAENPFISTKKIEDI